LPSYRPFFSLNNPLFASRNSQSEAKIPALKWEVVFSPFLKIIAMIYRLSLLLFVLLWSACSAPRPQYLNPFPIKPTGYTHAVITDNQRLLFISGQVPTNEKGEIIGKGDLEAQTRQVFENLKTILQASGSDFAHVIKTTTFVKNYKPEDIPVIRKVCSAYYSTGEPPASTLVGVQSLFNPDILIEIEAIAVIPK
jgi:enamine deaminase RidA (YjgF/YER057c/UK114 family)